ncbi:MAG: hypothetical protein QXW34_03745, partial [Candidatus Methanomethyliaceae archaeon]
GSYSVRRTTCLAEIKEYNREKNELIINYLARWDPNEDTHIMEEESVVLNRISEEKGIPMKEIMNNINKRKHILKWMVNKGMRRYMEIGSILREYYTDSEGVFRRALVEIT